MGLFKNKAAKGPRGNVLPQWSTDAIVSQHRLAERPPELIRVAQDVIAHAGRGQVVIALERLYFMLAVQTDAYVSNFPELKKYDFEAIRNELMSRPDFEEEMLFSYLTYFGPSGVAMNNGLVEQVPAFADALLQAAREGHLDGA